MALLAPLATGLFEGLIKQILTDCFFALLNIFFLYFHFIYIYLYIIVYFIFSSSLFCDSSVILDRLGGQGSKRFTLLLCAEVLLQFRPGADPEGGTGGTCPSQ